MFLISFLHMFLVGVKTTTERMHKISSEESHKLSPSTAAGFRSQYQMGKFQNWNGFDIKLECLG